MMNWRLIVLLLFLIGCNLPNKDNEVKEEFELVKPKYSKLFYVKVYSDKKELIIKNPWDSSSIYKKYIIHNSNDERFALLSGASVGFFSVLEGLDKVVGVGFKKHVYNEKLLGGNIEEFGESHQLNVEKLISAKVSHILVSGFEKSNKNYEVIKRSGIEVLETLEWMEQHPLARAEWIKFYGAVLGEEKLADRIFSSVADEYSSLAEIPKEPKPAIMFGNNYKEVWYTPGGTSFMAKLAKDAGADYFWNKEKEAGSLALSIEEVLKNQIDASYWFNPGAFQSVEELTGISPLLREFKSVKDGNVYNYTKRKRENGGNDFWELGVVYPNLLLKDYVQILHPDLLPENSLWYYEKVK